MAKKFKKSKTKKPKSSGSSSRSGEKLGLIWWDETHKFKSPAREIGTKIHESLEKFISENQPLPPGQYACRVDGAGDYTWSREFKSPLDGLAAATMKLRGPSGIYSFPRKVLNSPISTTGSKEAVKDLFKGKDFDADSKPTTQVTTQVSSWSVDTSNAEDGKPPVDPRREEPNTLGFESGLAEPASLYSSSIGPDRGAYSIDGLRSAMQDRLFKGLGDAVPAYSMDGLRAAMLKWPLPFINNTVAADVPKARLFGPGPNSHFFSYGGPKEGTDADKAWEEFVHLNSPLLTGTYRYNRFRNHWVRFSPVPVTDGLDPDVIGVIDHRVPKVNLPWALPSDYLTADAKVPFFDLGGAPTPEHSDLRAYREGAANLASKETPVPDDTNTEPPLQAPSWAQPIPSTAPSDDPDQVYVSKLVQTGYKRTLHYRIEVDPNAAPVEGRPCYRVLVPTTVMRNLPSAAVERVLPEVGVAAFLTEQHHRVSVEHDEINKRVKESESKREELDRAVCNMRGLVQVRHEFETQLADRQELPDPAPDSDAIHVHRVGTRLGHDHQELSLVIAPDLEVRALDDQAPTTYRVTMPGLGLDSHVRKVSLPEDRVVRFLTDRRERVLAQREAAKKAAIEAKKAVDETQRDFEFTSLHHRILGDAIDDFVQKRADRDDRRAEQEQAGEDVKKATRPPEPPRTAHHGNWRPTIVTFVKNVYDKDDEKRVPLRYTAVREANTEYWFVASLGGTYNTWDELMDQIQEEETAEDLPSVMSEIRYQQSLAPTAYRATELLGGWDWIAERWI